MRFFLGRGEPQRDDEVILDVDDDYRSLCAKMRAACQWADAHDYDFVYKSDDDAYVVPERLRLSEFAQNDYTGRVRGPSGAFPAPYCSGFGYWLSRKAIKIIASSLLNGDDAEDRYVANTLLAAGIRPKHDTRYAVINSYRNSTSGCEPPLEGNDLIAACEFSPDYMKRVHADYISGRRSTLPVYQQPNGELSKVSILIKTFLRDDYLFRCLAGLERNFADAKLVIVDDGYESNQKIRLYAELRARGHSCVWLAFDSGFGAKANEGVRYCDREYVLIASDDFDFSHPGARTGVEKMLRVLEADSSIDIASGRVNGRAYESCLQLEDHSCREIPGFRETRIVGPLAYHVCDLTVNYSLIRRSCFGSDRLHWDEDVKIGGGEHGAFFVDAKRLGYGVALVDGAEIREYSFNFALMHPMYPQFRKRASMPGRICHKRRGIDQWILQDGTIEVS